MLPKAKITGVITCFGHPTNKVKLKYSTGAEGAAYYPRIATDANEDRLILNDEVARDAYSAARIAKAQRAKTKKYRMPGSRKGVDLASKPKSSQMYFGRHAYKIGDTLDEKWPKFVKIGYRIARGDSMAAILKDYE